MMHRRLLAILVVCHLAADKLVGDEFERYADHWVATDALGRSLPTHNQTGPRRADKQVGIFYFVWVGNHTRQVFDNTKILKQKDLAWGPVSATHFWGQPEYGYFHASDPWVIRRDMQMLANADVDFIYLDVTNTLIYENTVEQLLRVIESMRREGTRAPQVVFTTNASSGRTMNRIYDRFYKDPKNAGLWFEWQGRPLIFGIAADPELRKELREYFTIKRSWAWTAAKTKPNHWQWQDTYPQDYGWSESPEQADQISVSAASHAANSMGKSYHNGKQPAVSSDYTTEFTPRGLYFEEQWKRAHQVDPKVVMISGWNEWIAGRFIRKPGDPNYQPLFAGRSPLVDGTTFVDAFNAEFTRDIAPMRGGYSDNYYYQMVGHIRRFKGLAKTPQRAESQEITIDGDFDDWQKVASNYRDPPSDTEHRQYEGTDRNTIYTNKFGRNDIVSAQVVESNNTVHFLVSTRDKLSPHTDPHWMRLLIDTDQSKETGWQGYDLALNWKATSSSKSTYAKWVDDQWQVDGEISIGYQRNQLELSVPNKCFPRQAGQGFDFKWVDNCRLQSVESLFLEGDVAPDRRFDFRY